MPPTKLADPLAAMPPQPYGRGTEPPSAFEFVTRVAHELRAPLTAILGWVVASARHARAGSARARTDHRESLNHVFDPFWQADGADHSQGLGLGLGITREIVELHGGIIDVASDSDGLGRGTIVTVLIPLRTDRPVA